MLIEDWEIGALFWNCRSDGADNQQAIEKVRQRYFDDFIEKDLYFYLGTTKRFHKRAKNPFMIIGIFYPPKDPQENQVDLFDS